MSGSKTANKNAQSGRNRIEEVKSSNGSHTGEVKERPFDPQISEGLMQTLEDPI
jgi:hypothetical protein